MSKKLFTEGGPHRIRKVARDQYEMSVSIPTDELGSIARECPDDACSPGYFKVTPDTGMGTVMMYCPYCRHHAKANDFATQEQVRYAKDMMLREAEKGLDAMLKSSLGIGPSGRRKLGGGLLSMELSFKSRPSAPVRHPMEEEVRRDVVCPRCALGQTVFGLATWCADCGEDIFLTHVEGELSVVRQMLEDVARRKTELGRRVAGKDLENCLEDCVSIFEASLKALTRKTLTHRSAAVAAEMKKVGASFQNVDRTLECLLRLFAFMPEEKETWSRLGALFEKRHPVTHNLGVVDKKYLERARASESEGREVRISTDEVTTLLADVYAALSEVHKHISSNP